VDRHRFEADPDLTFHFDGDPDPNTTPVLHMLENPIFYNFYSQQCVLVTGVIFHCIRIHVRIKTSADSQPFFGVLSQFKLFYYFIIKERQQFHKVAKKINQHVSKLFPDPLFLSSISSWLL
jgi:hypothetical protein